MKKTLKKTAAIMISAAMLAGSSLPASASAVDNYILFLPKTDMIEYGIDEEHVSDEYTTEKYTILFYKPGELVELEADTDQMFYIEDALETTVYSSYETAFDGKVRFIMPEEDLLLVIKDENGNTIDTTAESEPEAEPESEESIPDQDAEGTEDTAAEDADEDAGVQETEAVTEISAPAGNAENGGNNHVYGDPGTITLKLFGNIKADVTMVGNKEEKVPENGSITSDTNIDIFTITSENGNWNNPDFKLYKDGEIVNDTSNIIINNGGWNGKYLIDLKNSWKMENSAWTLEIKENGYVEPVQEDEMETEPEEMNVETAEEIRSEETGSEATEVKETKPVERTEEELEKINSFRESRLPENDENKKIGFLKPKKNTKKADELNNTISEFRRTIFGKEKAEVKDSISKETEAPSEESKNYSGVIDADIPSNYVPVPGKENMYMVLDDIGIVTNYVIRVKKGNNWEWEEVLPNIADVPGEDNVFMISNQDGSVSYYRYTRNPDNSYMFEESDEEGNVLK